MEHSVDLDQTPHSVASDMGLYCLSRPANVRIVIVYKLSINRKLTTDCKRTQVANEKQTKWWPFNDATNCKEMALVPYDDSKGSGKTVHSHSLIKDFVIHLKETDKVSGETTLSKLFASPSEKGFTLKRNEFALKGSNLFPFSGPLVFIYG